MKKNYFYLLSTIMLFCYIQTIHCMSANNANKEIESLEDFEIVFNNEYSIPPLKN